MANRSTQSALVGSAPATDVDYWIIKGMLRAADMEGKADPADGFTLFAQPEDGSRTGDRGTGIVVAMAICIAIITLATGLRLGVRLLRSELRWGADDWVLIPAGIMAISYPCLQIAMVKFGGGKHIWQVTYEEYNMFNWLAVPCKIIFFTTVGVIKISITLFNRRLTNNLSSRRWRRLNDGFLAVLTAYTLVALVWTCFQCSAHPAAMWDLDYAGRLPSPGAACYSTATMANALSIIHVVMDLCLLGVPMVVLWKVRLPRATKARLGAVFGTGAVSCVGSILRQIAQNDISLDVTWGYTGILEWTMVDLTFCALTASLPVIVGMMPKSARSRGHTQSGATTKNNTARSHAHHVPYAGGPLSAAESEEGILHVVREEFELEDKGSRDVESEKA